MVEQTRRQRTETSEGNEGASRPAGLRAGELAAQTGVSTDTLRHYERKGVLAAPRRLANGYRCYLPAAIERVRAIRAALALGFTLDELAPLFRARERGRPPCRTVRELAAGKLLTAEAQLADLAALVEALRALLTNWDQRLGQTAPGEAAHLLEGLALRPPSRSTATRRPPNRKGAP